MNYVWALIMLLSIICAIATGRVTQLSESVLNGAQDAVNILLSTLGLMCLWSGIMEIADRSGITDLLAKLFSPIMSRIFKSLDKNSKAMRAICLNITANLLGLGNAATPFGIKAMNEMVKENNLRDKTSASNAMVMFVVINTASLQLIPTMMSGLRIKYGSLQPFDVLPVIWISSFCALLVGIITAKIFERQE